MLALFGFCLATLVALGSGLSLPVNVALESLNQENSGQPGKVIVFGDSFSDNGTGAWTVSNHTWPVDPAYDEHRFSNGPVWIEDVATTLGMTLHDNAIGGATSNNSATQGFTGPGSTIPVPSALDQVDTYLSTGTIGPHDLVVIMIGANDAFFGGTLEPVIAAIQNIVHRLHGKGATKFLLASYPNLGRLPYRQFTTPAITEGLDSFSESLQASLENLWHQLCESHFQVGFVDSENLFRDMLAHPSAYGFDPATTDTSCLVGAYSEAPRTLCSDPDRYIFWDEYHVTRASHHFLAQVALGAAHALCHAKPS